jgi:hypothetical protein
MPSGEDLTWLVGRRLQSFVHRDYDWVATFDGEADLVITCLWRLIENGRIRFTSQDEGQWFGLPAPVNAAAEVTSRIAGTLIEAVELREETLDLEIHLNSGHALQIIPDSSGYEAWNLTGNKMQFIAVGGGDLAIFRDG